MVELRVEPYDPDLSFRWEVRRVGKMKNGRTPGGYGKWKMRNGKWKMENGKYDVDNDSRNRD
ncbi:hypothetical protein Syun_018222 [Stephania yunnanensis]|uniref:Uncharacterized protein n=1 Tax=Stephania yunnanensis TaxID=152371 RepID=A0AAP0ISI1_9MAGN